MADNLTKAQRHKNMQNIRSKDTSIEIKFRKALFHTGFRYIKNDKQMIGKPDIILPKYKTIIFIHGCFWHRHENCKYASSPSTNSNFWQSKFANTVKRDKLEQQKLRDAGWNIIIIWECEIKYNFQKTLENTILLLRSYL